MNRKIFFDTIKITKDMDGEDIEEKVCAQGLGVLKLEPHSRIREGLGV